MDLEDGGIFSENGFEDERFREPGYQVVKRKDLPEVLDISESTLYPVLRRLLKDGCLESYDLAIDGRNRRYYRITESGRLQLNLYRGEWNTYAQKISRILEEDIRHE